MDQLLNKRPPIGQMILFGLTFQKGFVFRDPVNRQ